MNKKIIEMPKRKTPKMTKQESKKYAGMVDSYIKRTAPLIQRQLEHLLDAGLKLHEPNYKPALVKGRIDSQPRELDGTTRDYFLDGNIFLSVQLPSMDFDKKGQSIISMLFRMYDKKGNPVDDNEISLSGKIEPVIDYSMVLELIKQLNKYSQHGFKMLDSKDIVWCSSVDWYQVNGVILCMDDMKAFCKTYINSLVLDSKEHIKIEELMFRIFKGDLFDCFFKGRFKNENQR